MSKLALFVAIAALAFGLFGFFTRSEEPKEVMPDTDLFASSARVVTYSVVYEDDEGKRANSYPRYAVATVIGDYVLVPASVVAPPSFLVGPNGERYNNFVTEGIYMLADPSFDEDSQDKERLSKFEGVNWFTERGVGILTRPGDSLDRVLNLPESPTFELGDFNDIEVGSILWKVGTVNDRALDFEKLTASSYCTCAENTFFVSGLILPADVGGPVFLEKDGKFTLVAISSNSYAPYGKGMVLNFTKVLNEIYDELGLDLKSEFE